MLNPYPANVEKLVNS